ncbi:MAG: hypothetical protein JXA78_08280 [Anaerolineales bacterium]|nr:hypothetical protein [Anaerolineales bacterium]
MANDSLYDERIHSHKTEALFLALTTLFLALLTWRVNTSGLDGIAIAFLCLFVMFLFYSLNFRILVIHLTRESLKLRFGVFTWTIPIDNIEECRLDDIPVLVRMGGAGIHFMSIRHRYRASFNFLEYPRVVIMLKRKAGLVSDISFSTRRPDDVLRSIREAISAT